MTAIDCTSNSRGARTRACSVPTHGDAKCFPSTQGDFREQSREIPKHPVIGPKSVRGSRKPVAVRRAVDVRRFEPYKKAIELRDRVDFAQLIKVYANSHEGERRYSPPDVVEAITAHKWDIRELLIADCLKLKY
jgi:hypothetical protein